MQGRQMKSFRLFLPVFLLAAVSFIIPINEAQAKICGCYLMSRWYCAPSMAYCTPKCGASIEMFPTRAACLARGHAAEEPAKAKTPAPKVVQSPAAKKPPVKVAQKAASTKPNSPKTTLLQKSTA